jgi:hypothetical protein
VLSRTSCKGLALEIPVTDERQFPHPPVITYGFDGDFEQKELAQRYLGGDRSAAFTGSRFVPPVL